MSPTRILASSQTQSACRVIPTQLYLPKVATNGISKKPYPLQWTRSHRTQLRRNKVSLSLIQDGFRLQQTFASKQISSICYSSSASSSASQKNLATGSSIQVEHTSFDQWIKGIPIQLSAATYNIISKCKNWSSPTIKTNASSPLSASIKSSVTLEKEHSEQAAIAPLPNAAPPPATKPPVASTMVVSKSSLDSRTRFLVSAVAMANSDASRQAKVEDLCRFLRQYPDARSLAVKVGAIRQLLSLKQGTRDMAVQEETLEGLILLGYCKPPGGWGIRILSIDGGGLRGIMALEILRQLESLTGQPVHKMFDYICGVSTGAVLTVLLGALKSTVMQCEDLYKDIGKEIFQQNRLWGTGKLVLSHAFYDTDNWTKLLRKHIGEKVLLETARDENCPKIATISAVVNRPRLEPYLFRNYDFPPRVRSLYPGTHTAHLWEAIRASAAAPGYFEECKLGDDVHQDGGILVNNPTALALHECKHLWPNESLQCVVSLGSGRFEPLQTSGPAVYTGLKNKLMKIVDSATDTEAVHTILHDLLPPTVYFRFNPYLSENTALDETRQEKIVQLQDDTKMYLRRNESKLNSAANLLSQPRSRLQNVRDFISMKMTTLNG